MIEDNYNGGDGILISGQVRAQFNTPGQSIRLVDTSNVVTYAAADLVAETLAGRKSAPLVIGMLYGPNATPALSHPGATREHTLEDLSEQTDAIGGNVLLASLSLTPSLQAFGPQHRYRSNRIIYSANSGNNLGYLFSGVGFADPVPDYDPVYFYQVVLLSRAEGAYHIFARASLMEGGVYKAKPDGFDLAVQWSITFK